MTTKQCYECKEVKPLTEFNNNKNTTTGKNSYCKPCHVRRTTEYEKENREARSVYYKDYKKRNKIRFKDRDRNAQLKFNYGITLDDFNNLLRLQGGGCAICGKTNLGKSLCVDHDHKTGKVRGLLCDPCNTTLGKMEEDIKRIWNMIKYLVKHNGDDLYTRNN